jgi:DNA-binding NarL/FixJ family response regulator
MSIRTLLADDHPILREGVCSVLKKESDIEVVDIAEDGRKALALVEKLLPDVVVMDITMPNLNGIDATRQIVHEFPEVKVIALSIHSSRRFVINMLKAGASGYILKECTPGEIVKAIRAVSAGEVYLAPLKVVSMVAEWAKSPQKSESLLDILTDREREVFQLTVEGKNPKQIGLMLHITRGAADAIVRKIKKKLSADSIAKLVIIALQEGIISLEH